MITAEINIREENYQSDNYIAGILHGSKNVFIKKRYLNSKRDYQSYFVLNTGREIVKSFTVLYSNTSALRRFYSGIPSFIPDDDDRDRVEKFRTYLTALNDDVISFLSQRITVLRESDNPLALYVIPELICNGVKANYIIEKKISAASGEKFKNHNCMLEVVCLSNRRKPDHIDLIMRNYARYHDGVEKSIEDALNSRWTKRVQFRNEKKHRENTESSEYGLPSINNVIKKYYNGKLFYDGYDDSFPDFGAYQFTMRLPKGDSY